MMGLRVIHSELRLPSKHRKYNVIRKSCSDQILLQPENEREEINIRRADWSGYSHDKDIMAEVIYW